MARGPRYHATLVRRQLDLTLDGVKHHFVSVWNGRDRRSGRTARQPCAASCAFRQPPINRPVSSSARAACS